MRGARALLASHVAVAALVMSSGCDASHPPASATRSRLLDEHVAVPSDDVLDRARLDAIALERLEDLDRALDAKEPGEQLEHATLSQIALDRGVYTNADLLRVGDSLFAYPFRPEQGLGNALAGRPGIPAGPNPAPNLRRVQGGELGGPDAAACAECHSVGGDDGAGTLTQNAYVRGDGDSIASGDPRNAPAVLGLGPVELLAAQLTDELVEQREQARMQAVMSGASVTWPLVAAGGLTYGELVAHPDGSIDSSRVQGVSPDLVVRPFGWKGHQATLRGMVKEAFRAHMGVVALADQQAIRDGVLPASWYGDGPWFDVDRDGTNIEVEDGMLSTMVAYLAQLEVPVVLPPDDPALLERFARGRAVFERVGCDTCHVPSLTLRRATLATFPEQTEHASSAPVTIDVARDGRAPKIEPVDLLGSAFVVRLFSDLRRHDLGPELAGQPHPAPGGTIAAAQWLTRPLWGLADSAPYLHDGRAPTVVDAILAHGGDATESRERFVAEPDAARADLLVFLLSLRRVPMVVAR